jgi:hypothetical protein
MKSIRVLLLIPNRLYLAYSTYITDWGNKGPFLLRSEVIYLRVLLSIPVVGKGNYKFLEVRYSRIPYTNSIVSWL